jgi:carnosine N-methyltransferase
LSSLVCFAGLLVNIGPLLYHYSDMPNEISIDLSYDELKAVMPNFGLRIVVRQVSIRSSFSGC